MTLPSKHPLCHPGHVWTLDQANSGDLIARLRPHAHRFTLRAADVGEGWRPLVEECHERLQSAFPDYELLAVKQKYGALDYQAFPRPWAQAASTGQHRKTPTCEPSPTRSATARSTSANGAEQPGSTAIRGDSD